VNLHSDVAPQNFSVIRERAYLVVGGLVAASILIVAGMSRGDDLWLVAWMGLFGLAVGTAAGIDVRERRLPNAITYPGIITTLAVAAFAGLSVLASAIGGLLLAGGLMAVAFWFGRGSLGLGDVKLSAFVGGFLGIAGVPHYLLFGTLLGAVMAVLLLIGGKGRRATFAYGPALVAGAVLAVITSGAVVG